MSRSISVEQYLKERHACIKGAYFYPEGQGIKVWFKDGKARIFPTFESIDEYIKENNL